MRLAIWGVCVLLSAPMWGGTPLAAQPVTARIELDRNNPLPSQLVEAHISVDLTSSGISLGAYQAKLSWDPAVLALTRIGDGETFAFQGPLTRLDESELTFSHFSVNGANGLVSLSKPQFQVIGAAGDSTQLTLSFEALAAADSFADLLPQLAIIPAVAHVATAEVDVEVTVKMPPGSEKLGAYEAFLSWDPQTRQSGEGGLSFANFSVERAGGRVSLLNATFGVIGDAGDRTIMALHFQILDAAGSFASLRSRLGVVPVIINVLATPVPHSPDFNGDNIVSLDDFFMFSEAFGTTDADFDIDGDGVVGFDDYFRFADSYGQPAPALE